MRPQDGIEDTGCGVLTGTECLSTLLTTYSEANGCGPGCGLLTKTIMLGLCKKPECAAYWGLAKMLGLGTDQDRSACDP